MFGQGSRPHVCCTHGDLACSVFILQLHGALKYVSENRNRPRGNQSARPRVHRFGCTHLFCTIRLLRQSQMLVLFVADGDDVSSPFVLLGLKSNRVSSAAMCEGILPETAGPITAEPRRSLPHTQRNTLLLYSHQCTKFRPSVCLLSDYQLLPQVSD